VARDTGWDFVIRISFVILSSTFDFAPPAARRRPCRSDVGRAHPQADSVANGDVEELLVFSL